MRQYRETSASALARQTIKDIEQILDDNEYQKDSKFAFLFRQRLKKYKNHSKSTTNSLKIDNNESSESSEFITEDDKNLEDSQSENESVNNQDSENFENYSSSDYELSQDPSGVGLTINDRFLWILL